MRLVEWDRAYHGTLGYSATEAKDFGVLILSGDLDDLEAAEKIIDRTQKEEGFVWHRKYLEQCISKRLEELCNWED